MQQTVAARRVALAALVAVGTASLGVSTGGGKEVPVRFGFGCAFSDYSAMTSSDDASAPSFRLLHDFGLGKGVYTLHFSAFSLPNDDFVLLRGKNVDKNSPDAVVLAGRNSTGNFFSPPIVGEGFVFELYRNATTAASSNASGGTTSSCHGVEVIGMVFAAEKQAEAAEESRLAIGLPQMNAFVEQSSMAATRTKKLSSSSSDDPDKESVCGTDESQEAICLLRSNSPEEKAMYNTSKAVARLMIRKDNNMNVAYCTGFLLGCEGHLITNQHCIRNWLDALNTYIEFFAESPTCGSKECDERGTCPGRFAASKPELVAVSTELDYALVKLTSDSDTKMDITSFLAQVGGFMQLRAGGPKLQEEIYIPQHPLGKGKRVAWTSNSQPGRVESLAGGECGGKDVGYYVDTEEGSSGSPVIAKSDNTVVALHHCGGCLNGAISSQKLIADMETKGVLPRCAIAP
ncbi:hypothetical protein PybrP1_002789 [[Pythium] brassicae (nom. inval.)]|nr:hypothetical protein PybrP1_002789 [[Pythium] brassicae (nom. inval.)]